MHRQLPVFSNEEQQQEVIFRWLSEWWQGHQEHSKLVRGNDGKDSH